jgi:hypothetical protein
MAQLLRVFDDGNRPLVGPGRGPLSLLDQRSLIQSFEPAHRHPMEKIPGIRAMREKFK